MIGSIANNRFLQRVNPEIKRALNETGAAASMRQMVDLDIAKNLVGWWHKDNVETRVSGSDTFITQANDSSGGTNHATQTTEANQPELVSDGMEFESDLLDMGLGSILNIINGANAVTMSVWVYGNNWNNQSWIVYGIINSSLLGVSIRINVTNPMVGGRSHSSDSFQSLISSREINLAQWYHFVGIVNYTTSQFYIYIDGEQDSTGSANFSQNKFTGGTPTLSDRIGNHPTSGRDVDGRLNDIRIYNKTLSASEIAAIHNQTKGAYGL